MSESARRGRQLRQGTRVRRCFRWSRPIVYLWTGSCYCSLFWELFQRWRGTSWRQNEQNFPRFDKRSGVVSLVSSRKFDYVVIYYRNYTASPGSGCFCLNVRESHASILPAMSAKCLPAFEGFSLLPCCATD